ncbi:hypothetical protein [Umezawaea sp. Da 62-37]|uniref:hypothetical protein n=1 Tax=Umezawaea sp. Da 62-37 TaxID=3075927 RepID=UPI0028F6D038|nr:hypothetical protein [Umezawaea sp. Da 62-37]WNV86684.1 hypothetical protein RM788_52660 [Umezawaea sp. Da 62-37]WNV86733.1 hypothetical protein RM788_00145 [Umezawaea sp. Da 62-37]
MPSNGNAPDGRHDENDPETWSAMVHQLLGDPRRIRSLCLLTLFFVGIIVIAVAALAFLSPDALRIILVVLLEKLSIG